MADVSEVIRPVIRSKDGACLQGQEVVLHGESIGAAVEKIKQLQELSDKGVVSPAEALKTVQDALNDLA